MNTESEPHFFAPLATKCQALHLPPGLYGSEKEALPVLPSVRHLRVLDNCYQESVTFSAVALARQLPALEQMTVEYREEKGNEDESASQVWAAKLGFRLSWIMIRDCNRYSKCKFKFKETLH